MAFKHREEIVGKRFLSVRSAGKLKLSKISEWEWRAGVVRATTHKDPTNPDISVLVEFDDIDWQRREWIRVHEIFQIFLVEHTLIWAPRQDPGKLTRNKVPWPGLSFKPLVDMVAYGHCRSKPVEFLGDCHVEFVEDVELKLYKEDDLTIESPAKEDPNVRKAVRRWLEYQDGQSILLTTPSVLVGFRVEVYRAEGTTQWYTAVIQSYNDNTKELSVTDDTVLEEHNEDPAQVQMKLIGEGVVESILKGENLGITPRRRSCTSKDANHRTIAPVRYTRNRSLSPSHSASPSVKGSNARNKSKQRTQDSTPPVLQPETRTDKGNKSAEKSTTPRNRRQWDRKRKSEEPSSSPSRSPTTQESNKKLTTPANKRSRSSDPLGKSAEKRSVHPDTVSVKSGNLPPETQPTVVVKPVKHLLSGSTNVSPASIKTSPVKEKVKTRRSKGEAKESLAQGSASSSKLDVKVSKLQDSKKEGAKSSPVKEKKERVKSAATDKEDQVKDDDLKDDRSRRAKARAEKSKVKSAKSEEKTGANPSNSQDVGVLTRVNKFGKQVQHKEPKNTSVECSKASQAKFLTSPCTKTTQLQSLASEYSKTLKVQNVAPVCSKNPQVRNPISESKSPQESSTDCPKNTHQVKSTTELDCTKSQTATSSSPMLEPGKNQPSKPASNPLNRSVNSPVTKSSDYKVDSELREPCRSQNKEKFKDNVADSLPATSETKKNNNARRGNKLLTPEGKTNKRVLKSLSSVSSPASSCSSKHEREIIMHYKKNRILNTKKEVPESSSTPETITDESGINVNHSLTDQLAKRASIKEKESLAWNNNELVSSSVCSNSSPLAPPSGRDGYVVDASRTVTPLSSLPVHPMNSPHSHPHSGGMVVGYPERVDPARPRDNGHSTNVAEPERSHSRASDDRSSSRASVEDKRPSSTASSSSLSRIEDSKKHKEGDSPLVFDKAEPVRVYRDPELLKKDEMRYMPMQPHRHTPVPTQVQSSYPNVHTPIPQALPSSLSVHHPISAPHSRTLLSPAPTSLYGPQLPQGLSLSPHHLSTLQSHIEPQLSGLSPLSHQQTLSLQYPQHILSPSPHMLSAYRTLQTAQLEMLWQQKYPTLPVPPPWMLNQYQDELLRDVNLIRDRDLAIDRERREREVIIERERTERERQDRERAERERREREERERIERERKEREKAERERLEKERLEKERLERERQERERQEREQQERLERERVLKESAEAAVNHHFKESLRLASQKKQTSNWSPSICLGIPKPSPGAPIQGPDRRVLPHPAGPSHLTAPHPTASHPGSGSHPSAFKHLLKQPPISQQHPPHHMATKDPVELHKSEEKMRLEEQARTSEEKRALSIQQEQTLRAQFIKEQEAHQTQQLKESVSMSMAKAFPGHPAAGPAGVPSQASPHTAPNTGAEQHPVRPGFAPYGAHQHNPGAPAAQVTNSGPNVAPPTSSAAPASGVKQEPHFNLYGYQPQHQMYISQDKLAAHIKDEKPFLPEQMKGAHRASPAPNAAAAAAAAISSKGQIVNPPPLIKDQLMAKTSSVIVENRPKEGIHHGSITLGTAMSPRPNMCKDVKPEVKAMPISTSTAASSAPVLQAKLGKKPDVQNQLRVSSPNQLPPGIKVTTPGLVGKQGQPTSLPPTVQISPQDATTLRQYMATIAQPPVSLPHTTGGISYSLIQQGLVPNPIYSPNSSVHSAKVNTNQQPTQSTANAGVQTTGTNTLAAMVQKRRIQKEMVVKGKKPKVEGHGILQSTAGPTIPVTTQPIATNPQPYTTMSNSSHPGTSHTNSAFNNCQPSPGGQTTKSSGFLDSFRSFVENTVHNAFLNDQDLGGGKFNKGRHKTVKTTTASNTSTTTSHPVTVASAPGVQQAIPSSTNTTSSLPSSLPSSIPHPMTQSSTTIPSSASSQEFIPFQSHQQHLNSLPSQLTGAARPGPANTPGGASVTSISSITDSNNRANGYLESDSDTLSAPSPPPHIKSGEMRGASPIGKSGIHAKCKKAWLMRYSDEDKDKGRLLERPSDASNSGPESKAETLKDCYVNCSYISPTKEGGNKSPIGLLKNIDPKDDDSTTSASEAESQGPDGSHKRRMKPKHRRGSTGSNASKKAKVMDMDERSNSSGCVKKRFIRKGVKDSQSNASSEAEEELPEDKKMAFGAKAAAPAKVRDLKSESNNKGSSDSESSKPEKKRGRKPRDKDTPVRLTENPSQSLANKPLNRAPLAKLKKTQEPFLQDGPCVEVAPKLTKCRECKMTPTQRNKKLPNIFCRFYAFRRIRYNAKGTLAIAGFSEPSDAENDDIELWMPRLPLVEPVFDVGMAKYIIANVGDRFCELVEQEKEAMSWVSPDTKIAWKRAVQGVREMCDVCDTTLFNMHWVCHKCGFVVCIDCYRQRTRKAGGCADTKCTTCDQDGVSWLTCSVGRNSHEPEKLMLTQIIPSDALWVVGDAIHEVRDKWRIRSNCPCGRSTTGPLMSPKNGVNQLLSAVSQCVSPDSNKPIINGISDEHGYIKNKKKLSSFPENSLAIAASINGGPANNISPLNLLADVASMDSENNLDSKKALSKIQEKLASSRQFGMSCNDPMSPGMECQDGDKKNCSTLRELLTKTAGKMKPSPDNNKKPKTIHSTLDDIIQQVVERNLPKEIDPQCPPLRHYIPKNGSAMVGREGPIPQHTLTETSILFPDLPHSWLDNGKLLRLHEPHHKGNLKIFQQQWRRAQPVLVSNCDVNMDPKLWHPDWFLKEFGSQENDLVNCRSGVVLVGHPMKVFWQGFEYASKRMEDEHGNHMLLKLKDWPPTEDFCDLLPSHFRNLMNILPLPEYTHRNGVLNMAGRLPDFFVKPDLGPKMYSAYGSARYPKDGSTNLHLDVSDAVNVMVYVGVPEDDDFDHEEAVMKAIDEAGCCAMTKRRIKESGDIPGALWHIYDPHDADKIRDLLNKVGKERGEEVEPHHDPIHDQSWYLDEELRGRLLDEYGVQGYTIVQCKGDAVFLPAGAPHQVRNLHSCIKCAEDYVSPENLDSCFKMTQEFRHLSNTHSNHEDKLQVKNIIFHTVKDAVAVLQDADP